MATEVQGEQLDALVLQHLQQHAQPAPTPQDELRSCLLAGDFAAAAAAVRRCCAQLADNEWLQFQLKKHHFMQVAALAAAQHGSEEARAARLQEALALAKKELAPLALDAYVEAFSEFKQCMMALVAGPAAGGTDVGAGSAQLGAAPSEELRRFAGMVVRAARQGSGTAGAAGGLDQLLRYLLLLHQHQHHSGFHPYWWPEASADALALCKLLLLPERDALPPQDLVEGIGALHAGCVRETDVQALRTSLGCDREEAVALLRRATGNAFTALQDALQAAHIDEGLLVELAEEYASNRGLDVPPAVPQQAEQPAQGSGADSAGTALRSGQQGGADEAEAMQLDAAPGEQPQRHEQHPRPSKVARKEENTFGAEAVRGSPQEAPLELPCEMSEQQLRQLTRQLERQLASGRAEQALQQLEASDPTFLPDHPAVAFALHRCRFLQQLAAPAAAGAGGTAAALAVVRQHLTPLAQQHPELLQPQLKAVLAKLLPLPGGEGGEAAAAAQKQHRQGVADALVAVRAALRPRCHLREPRLLSLLRDLLSLHTAHFKLQRCQDRFAPELGVAALKASGPGGGASTASAAAAAAMAMEASEALAAAANAAAALRQQLQQHDVGHAGVPVPGVRVVSDSEGDDMEDDSDEEEEGGEEGVGVPEQAILTVCEFTGLPRHTAIELLLVHGGDPAAVLAHVFP